ncbi:12978_t:CDS:2, partial [Ambispora gerdemannii]
MSHIHKEYYSTNARYLSDKTIKDIKTSFKYIENWERKQQMIDSYPSQSRPLGDESEIRDSVSSLNHSSSSLHTSVKTSNQQIKK